MSEKCSNKFRVDIQIIDDPFDHRKMIFGKNISVSILNRNPPEVDLLNPGNKLPECSFTSWENVVPYYRKAHIFCVTDPEEVGLSVIENAMCGSFIFLMNSGYLPQRSNPML